MDDQKQPKFTIVFMPDDDEPDTPEFAALRKEMVYEFEVLMGLIDEDE